MKQKWSASLSRANKWATSSLPLHGLLLTRTILLHDLVDQRCFDGVEDDIALSRDEVSISTNMDILVCFVFLLKRLEILRAVTNIDLPSCLCHLHGVQPAHVSHPDDANLHAWIDGIWAVRNWCCHLRT